jgi:hypothetical protein
MPNKGDLQRRGWWNDQTADAQKGKSGHRGDVVLFELSVASDIVTKSFANISRTIPIGASNRTPVDFV